MVGRIIAGKYKLIEQVGSGGMAIVYKAKSLETDDYVAIKILRPELVEDEEFVIRFEREAQAVSSLKHPNIVAVYDVGQEESIYYIVMEYIHGLTLKELIRENKRLEIEEAIEIALQISDALEHAHRRGIIHRDIKPQNILIGDNNTVKVADFGIARAITSATITLAGSDVIGSVHYFSPEQAKGSHTDGKSDIYSLGIVLYEMVTGHLPFEGDSAVSIAIKHIQEKVTPPGEVYPQLPWSLQKIIEKCVKKTPEKRYESAEELYYDLKQSLENPEGDFVKVNISSDGPTQRMDLDEIELADNKEKRKSEIKPWVKALLAIIPFLIVSYFAYSIGSKIYKNNFMANNILVPNIVDKSLEEAQAILKEEGLYLRIEDSLNDEDILEGNILSQDPIEGGLIKADNPVKVFVSLGPELIPVAHVEGLNLLEAETILENDGFVIGSHEYINDISPKDTVIDQSYPGDTMAPKGSIIRLTVSLGEEEETVVVGSYVGQQFEVAKQMILSDGLSFGEVTDKRYSDTASEGIVIEQSLNPGELVNELVTINLVLSLGVEPNYPKILSVDLSTIEDKDTVNIVIEKIHEGITEEVYNRFHAVGNEVVDIKQEGRGSAVYNVYIDGDLLYQKAVDFSVLEDGGN